MKFHKLNGAGNDFIILNNLDGSISPALYSRLAAVLCRRRLSIGADGLMVIEPSQTADFRMAFYNADGSAGEMCGNGARCACRYGHEMGLAGDRQAIETPSGIVTGQRLDRRQYRIRLTDPTYVQSFRPAELDGAVYPCSYIELGTPGLPHAVLKVPGLENMDLEELRPLGRALRGHAVFPKGANISFYDLIAPDEAVIRTYERGVEDFTYACGTGSAATALAIAIQDASASRSIIIHNPGGDLIVEISQNKNASTTLHLTGPTNFVAVGEVLDEDLTDLQPNI